MTEEQKYIKGLIRRDLEYIDKMYDLDNRQSKLHAASHLYLVVRTIIILKADINGKSLNELDIEELIEICDGHKLNIEIPPLIREKASILNDWNCVGYNKSIRIRKDTILKIYNVIKEWYNTIE